MKVEINLYDRTAAVSVLIAMESYINLSTIWTASGVLNIAIFKTHVERLSDFYLGNESRYVLLINNVGDEKVYNSSCELNHELKETLHIKIYVEVPLSSDKFE